MKQQAWMNDLKTHLLRVDCSELGAIAARQLIAEEVGVWGEDRGLDARLTDTEPFTGQTVDVILDSPSGKTLAVMVSSGWDEQAIEVLRACKRNQWGSLWVRIDDPIEEGPEGIATISLALKLRQQNSTPPVSRQQALSVSCTVCERPAGKECVGSDLNQRGLHDRREQGALQVENFIGDLVARYAKTPSGADT